MVLDSAVQYLGAIEDRVAGLCGIAIDQVLPQADHALVRIGMGGSFGLADLEGDMVVPRWRDEEVRVDEGIATSRSEGGGGCRGKPSHRRSAHDGSSSGRNGRPGSSPTGSARLPVSSLGQSISLLSIGAPAVDDMGENFDGLDSHLQMSDSFRLGNNEMGGRHEDDEAMAAEQEQAANRLGDRLVAAAEQSLERLETKAAEAAKQQAAEARTIRSRNRPPSEGVASTREQSASTSATADLAALTRRRRRRSSIPIIPDVAPLSAPTTSDAMATFYNVNPPAAPG